jgi:hypothetical protein
MGDRLTKIIVFGLLIVLAVYVGQPYVDRFMFSASTPRAIAPRGNLIDLERTTIELFERVSPSVVQVVARHPAHQPMQAEGEGGEASGTGFVWDAAGHIVTNDHVVQGSGEVAVRFASGEVRRAGIVGTAPNYDLAVLRLDNTRGLPPPIPIGTSADLKVGQSVFAIGNPFGLDQSLTTGIISALKRRLMTERPRDRRRDPDRRGDQSGQFRRPAARLGGTRDRREHRDPLAVRHQRGHRLRHPGRHRQPGGARHHPPRLRADARHRHRRRQRGGGNARRRGGRGDRADHAGPRPSAGLRGVDPATAGPAT